MCFPVHIRFLGVVHFFFMCVKISNSIELGCKYDISGSMNETYYDHIHLKQIILFADYFLQDLLAYQPLF